MPIFSRPERYIILIFLTIGLLFTGFFYFKKTAHTKDIEIIDIEKPVLSIDINKASARELERLPGIGPVLASDIVRYREKRGRFKYPEELKEVKGIGDKKFEAIKDLVAIEVP